MNAPDMFAETFSDALKALGFAFFSQGDYNLNIIGVRSPETKAGRFDDVLFCLYRVGGIWRVHMWPITTDPSPNLLARPMGERGCAIMAAPQQCRGAYRLGKHKKRDALVQRRSVKVWRDNNRDRVLDWGPDEGDPALIGLNIHDTLTDDGITELNTSASAGCQVMPVKHEHAALLDVYRHAARAYGKWVTYTLIRSEDLGGGPIEL